MQPTLLVYIGNLTVGELETMAHGKQTKDWKSVTTPTSKPQRVAQFCSIRTT